MIMIFGKHADSREKAFEQLKRQLRQLSESIAADKAGTITSIDELTTEVSRLEDLEQKLAGL